MALLALEQVVCTIMVRMMFRESILKGVSTKSLSRPKEVGTLVDVVASLPRLHINSLGLGITITITGILIF